MHEGKKTRILIVEDSVIYMDIITTALRDEYNIIQAVDAEEALGLIRNNIVDLIILDIVLPRMNGFEFCRILKQNELTKCIPVIFSTTLSNSSEQIRGLELGAIDYICKPIDMNIVSAKIKNHVIGISRIKNNQSINAINQAELNINNILQCLVLLSEIRDAEASYHNSRTSICMKMLAEELAKDYPTELTPYNIDLVSKAAALHDIGKMGIKENILMKTEGLTNSEFEDIKQHTAIGKVIIDKLEVFLGTCDFLEIAKIVTESHHERWDGSGYPNGLKGTKIPLFARMMNVIDVYDALISERPYKKAFSHGEAIDIISNGDARVKPEHFDPDILKAFKRTHQKSSIIQIYNESNSIYSNL